jgi:hypothetical protein
MHCRLVRLPNWTSRLWPPTCPLPCKKPFACEVPCLLAGLSNVGVWLVTAFTLTLALENFNMPGINKTFKPGDFLRIMSPAARYDRAAWGEDAIAFKGDRFHQAGDLYYGQQRGLTSRCTIVSDFTQLLLVADLVSISPIASLV